MVTPKNVTKQFWASSVWKQKGELKGQGSTLTTNDPKDTKNGDKERTAQVSAGVILRAPAKGIKTKLSENDLRFTEPSPARKISPSKISKSCLKKKKKVSSNMDDFEKLFLESKNSRKIHKEHFFNNLFYNEVRNSSVTDHQNTGNLHKNGVLASKVKKSTLNRSNRYFFWR